MILCVNPWVDDFTAYDLWAKPLGIIEIASWLRQAGWDVGLVDLLYQHDPLNPAGTSPTKTGRGQYERMEIPRPEPLRQVVIPRKYYRYGVSGETAEKLLSRYPAPRLILVTSVMTYWYTGLAATVAFLKKHYPEVPVIIGGIYTQLCRDHAHAAFPDCEIAPREAYPFLRERLKKEFGHAPLLPGDRLALSLSYDFYPGIPYIPLRFSRGCPYRCRYCAGPLLEPEYREDSPGHVKQEFFTWYDKGVRDFVFYDDALLFSKKTLLHPFLEWMAEEGMRARFHTPNGLHIAAFDKKTLDLMMASGEWDLRFGVETLFKGGRPLDNKSERRDLERAASLLKDSGFDLSRVRIYLLAGLPHQSRIEVEENIKIIRQTGLRPIPNEYSPIPGTPLFGEALKASPFDLNEPLFQNKSIVPCRWEGQTWQDVQELKELARM